MTKTSSIAALSTGVVIAGASGLYLYHRYLRNKAASLEAELEVLRIRQEERRILLFKFGLGTIGVGLSILLGVRVKKFISSALFGETGKV